MKAFLSKLWISVPSTLKRFDVCFSLLLALATATLILIGPCLRIINIYPGDLANSQNRQYLFSAISQSLAALLGLVVSITLV